MPKLWDLLVWGVAASVGLVGCVNSAQRQLIPPLAALKVKRQKAKGKSNTAMSVK